MVPTFARTESESEPPNSAAEKRAADAVVRPRDPGLRFGSATAQPPTPRGIAVCSRIVPEHAPKACASRDKVAEREGFEPSVPLPVRLISNQVRSTKLRHLSAAGEASISFESADVDFCCQSAEMCRRSRDLMRNAG